MVGDEKETLTIVGLKISKVGERTSVKAWPLLGRKDRIATECTGDEQLPILQGQVPLHKHMQRDLISD